MNQDYYVMGSNKIEILISDLNFTHFLLSRDNQILKCIISRQLNPKFHYLETLEIMKVYNKYYIKPEKLTFFPYKF